MLIKMLLSLFKEKIDINYSPNSRYFISKRISLNNIASMVAHSYNPTPALWKAKAEGLQVQVPPEELGEILSQNKN